MKCPNCGGENVTVNVVNDIEEKSNHHSVVWWLLFGWYWVPFKWIFFTLPALIFKLLFGRRKKVVTTQRAVCCCQSCGHTWNKE